MKEKLTFSQALTGYLLDANARHLSSHTIADYLTTFKFFQAYLAEDPPVEEITIEQVSGFLASRIVSNKTILNYHIGLSAFFTWAIRARLVDESPMGRVPRPKPEQRVIEDITKEEIQAMLSLMDKSRVYSRPGKRESSHALMHADRNKSMLFLFLDTGVRVSEVCTLKICNCNLKLRRIMVFGKGAKERTIPFSARTGQLLWRYLSTCRKEARLNDLLFVTKNGLPMTPKNILDTFSELGERAGVHNVHPHRFRHTFAINYLRNGGDPFVLQAILGHTTMEMTRHYLLIAKRDLDNGHLVASPIDNWRL
jgi:integrase/recombinase XerD